jgi:hypothetical protein
MIGTASGGKLPITVYNAATGTDFNRAGRPMIQPVDYQDSFGALYKFAWSQLYQGDEQSGWGAVEFVGFVGDSGGQMFRQLLGALIQHKKSPVFGNYYVKLGVMLGAGTQDGFAGDSTWLNLGTGALNTNYQLSLEYNGSTHVLTVAFKNAAGATLRSMSADADNLLSGANLDQLNLTHVGWSDYSGAIGAWTATNIPFTWQVDELSFHQTLAPEVEVQSGACCLVETGTCLENVTATACAEQSGRFDGVGSACGQVLCQSVCPIPFADADRDGDVDLSDFASFQLCLTGEDDPQGLFDAEQCGCFDRGSDQPGDEDIDGSDFAKFMGCLNGPQQPAIPGCDN